MKHQNTISGKVLNWVLMAGLALVPALTARAIERTGGTPASVVDFNGDGKTDFAVVRNTGGGPNGQITWYVQNNGGPFQAAEWGLTTDTFVPADYDGDGRTDYAVWRSGAPTAAAFYVLNSQGNTIRIESFGQTGDDPTVVGDYDGDGRADLAVYRNGQSSGEQSYWFYRGSLNNPNGSVTYVPWGKAGDFPAPGDYDGDGKHDFVVQSNDDIQFIWARFWLLQTTAGIRSLRFGNVTDRIAPGDYDGDGKTDLCIVKNSSGRYRFWIQDSSTGALRVVDFGLSATDFITPGDYDGDGKTDLAIWRPSTTAGQSAFWVAGSLIGPLKFNFGQNADYPAANFNVH
ncbi:MAG: VCBS repeat-containing protein [Acidobacteria bacterium]|nr:VCBS repeat-containing protein [Acidobacteriota bacterium]